MGAEGVGLTNNVDCKICDDPEAFAMEAVELYNNSEMWTKLSTNALKISQRYSAEHIKYTLEQLFSKIK